MSHLGPNSKSRTDTKKSNQCKITGKNIYVYICIKIMLQDRAMQYPLHVDALVRYIVRKKHM